MKYDCAVSTRYTQLIERLGMRHCRSYNSFKTHSKIVEEAPL